MQGIIISIGTQSGQAAALDYADGWIGSIGVIDAAIGSDYYYRSGNIMPYIGSANIEMERIDGHVVLKWDSVKVLEGNYTDPVNSVSLVFTFYPYLYGPSFFGTESVDFIKVEGNVVPLPGALVLFGSGLLRLAFYSRRKLTDKN